MDLWWPRSCTHSPVYTRARVITRDTKWRIMIFRCDNPGNIAISSVKSLFHTRQPTPADSPCSRADMMNNRRAEISRAWKWKFSREGRLISAQFTDHGVVLFRWMRGRTRSTLLRHEGDGCNEIESIEFGRRVDARHVSVLENDRRSIFVSWYQLTVTWRSVDWITLSRETFARNYSASYRPITLRVVCFHPARITRTLWCFESYGI